VAELFDDSWEECSRPADEETDVERPQLAADRFLHIGDSLVGNGEDSAGILQKLLALVCEPNAPVLSIEERYTQLRLEISNLLANSRLGHVEDSRAASDASMFSNCGEIA
jgi:hypothetical protein